MEDRDDPPVSACNGSHNSDEENQGKKTGSLATRRCRYFLSDSVMSLNFKSLFDEDGKDSPRADKEDCPRSLESEAASTSDSESQTDSGSATKWLGFFGLSRKGPKSPTNNPSKGGAKLTREKMVTALDFSPVENSPPAEESSSLDPEFCRFKSSWKNFTLSALQAATNNFSNECLIGEGGYAQVYKGKLEDGQYVAIKRLTRGNPEEMTADFLSELGIIVHVDHPNVAKVIGYGVEGGMHLVLHLSPHGSLSSILYGPRERLNWGIRYKVALGTAEGLLYLHEGCQRRIIHKDIKASNILLTEDFDPQISDFGLAKWLPDQWTHHVVSNFEGTFGYLPPEFFIDGIVDEKTDVYAYGVLLLELITGRQALDSSQQSLVMWAKPLLSKNNIEELVDPCLAEAYDIEQMNCTLFTASICVHHSSTERPEMSQVVQILKGDESTLELVKQQQEKPKQRARSDEIFDAEESNSSTHSTDMDQHLQIVLGTSGDGVD